MSTPAPVAHTEIHYTGHVQGVGFRYSVLQVARGFEVTGVVENLADGRVRLVAEGERAEVDAFLEAVAERMHGYIRKVGRADAVAPRRHEGFAIR